MATLRQRYEGESQVAQRLCQTWRNQCAPALVFIGFWLGQALAILDTMVVVVHVRRCLVRFSAVTFALLMPNACTGYVSHTAGTPSDGDPGSSGQGPQSDLPSGTDGSGGRTSPGASGSWNGPKPFHRIGNDEFVFSALDLLGQANNTGLAASLRKTMPLESLGEHGFPQPGALGLLDVDIFLDKAQAAAASLDFTSKVEAKPLIACNQAPASAAAESTCAEATLQALATRAYRRPVASDETKDLLQAFTDARQPAGTSFLSALRVATAALLTSPSFLYHDEAGTRAAPPSGAVIALTDHELAARLAATLWRSIPDNALLASAASKNLGNSDGVKTQVQRMLADPRSLRGLMAFFDELTGTGDLAAQTRTAPEGTWNATVAGQLHDELAQLIKSVITDGDARYQTLLERGLLTKGAIMAAHAKANEASPIMRGRLIRERFLCDPIPAPPPNIPALPEAKTATQGRERFLEHSRNPRCVGCHERIDPIGFAFSNFDQLGRLMKTNEDTSGKVVDLDGKTSSFANVGELISLIAKSPQATSCFVTQWTRFALGRQLLASDEGGVRALSTGFNAAQGDFKFLFQGVFTSTAFRMQEITQ